MLLFLYKDITALFMQLILAEYKYDTRINKAALPNPNDIIINRSTTISIYQFSAFMRKCFLSDHYLAS